MNSARRDLETLNVLAAPSSRQSLLDLDVREMSDEQLEQGLRLLEQVVERQRLRDAIDGETPSFPEARIWLHNYLTDSARAVGAA